MDILLESNPQCEACGLCNNAFKVNIMGKGPRNPKIVVVVDSPSWKTEDTGEYISGKAGVMFSKLLNKFGLDLSDMYVTGAVKCRTPQGRAPGAKEIKACKPYLLGEIEALRPDYVILLGAVALKAALHKAGITDIHGTIIEKNGIKYYPMFHPAMALRDPKRMIPIRNDIERFSKIIRGEVVSKHKLKYRSVTNMEGLKSFFKDIIKSRVISFDLETTGLNPREPDSAITVLSMSTKKADWAIPFTLSGSPFKNYKAQYAILKFLEKILRNKQEVIAQNGKFDNKWLEVLFGLKFNLTFDTMLASHLVDENTPLGLKYIAVNELNGEPYDVDLKTKKGGGDVFKLLEYAAWDTYYTLKAYFHYKKILQQDGLMPLFRKEVMPAGRAYEQIEMNGVFINRPNMRKAKRKIKRDLISARKRLNAYSLSTDINWGSPKQVNNILFDTLALIPEGFTPKGEPSTASDFLGRMVNQHPIIQDLLDFRKANKLDSSFITGWEKRMVDGKWLYPSFKVPGTVTGRPSCSDPNLQQVPRLKLIRSLIGAPEGWTFFEADYSQMELRIAALLSQCPVMLEIFNNGGDIHSSTASSISGIPIDKLTKEERKKAKAVNFGFLYGMGWKTFIDYALDKYGVVLTEKQAKAYRKNFFKMYPGLEPWHAKQRRLVHSLGQVRTLTGRIRHLPEIDSPDKALVAQAERQSINAPVQGFGGELTMMSSTQIIQEMSHNDIRVCGTIHDAVVGRVRTSKAHVLLKQVKEIMESPRILKELGVQLNIPVVVDVSLGNWGDGQELKF